jgi:hypothetical protein
LSLPNLPGAALQAGAVLGSLLVAAFAPSRAPHAEGPPLGHTGGFGEPTCHACHNELELDAEGSGRLELDGLPERYEPGETYLLTIVLASEGMERAGFEAAFRFAGSPPPGAQAGTLAAGDDLAQVSYLGLTPVYYVRQTEAGSQGAAVVSWTFTWTAPDSSQPVTVHLAANSANGDNSPLGDFVLTWSRTVESAH